MFTQSRAGGWVEVREGRNREGERVALENEHLVARENGKFCSQMIPKIGGCSSGRLMGSGKRFPPPPSPPLLIAFRL